VIALIVGGSVITYMSNMEAPGAGPLKKDVELLNGRAAMIGIASLIGIEAGPARCCHFTHRITLSLDHILGEAGIA
jgi:hypothetical protein